jgi:hypothetical protein
MTIYKAKTPDTYQIGSGAPTVVWTVIRGDTASFRVYVTDDAKVPLTIADWTIKAEIKRPTTTPGIITDAATIIVTLHPAPTIHDGLGEFTVFLAATESTILQTGDIFDIELSLPLNATVWTVAQGTMNILEDVTNSV